MQTMRGMKTDNDDEEQDTGRPREWKVVDSTREGSVQMIRTIRHRAIKTSEVKIEEEEEEEEQEEGENGREESSDEDNRQTLSKEGVGDKERLGGDDDDVDADGFRGGKVISKQEIEEGESGAIVATSNTQKRLSSRLAHFNISSSNRATGYHDINTAATTTSSCLQPIDEHIDSIKSRQYQHRRYEQSNTITTVHQQASVDTTSASGGHQSSITTHHLPSNLYNYVHKQQQQQQTITETKRKQYSQLLSRKISHVPSQISSSAFHSFGSMDDISEDTIKMSSSEDSTSECATIVAKPFKSNEQGDGNYTFGAGQSSMITNKQFRKSYARSISFSSGVRTYSNCNKCITLQNMHRRNNANIRRLGVSCE